MVSCVEEIVGCKTLMVISSEGMPEKSGVFLSGLAAMFMPRGQFRGEKKITYLGLSRQEHSFSVPYNEISPLANEHGIFFNHSHGLVRFVNLGGIKTIKVTMLDKHGDYLKALIERIEQKVKEQEEAFQQRLRDEAAAVEEERIAVERMKQQELQLSLLSPTVNFQEEQQVTTIVSEESDTVIADEHSDLRSEVMPMLRGIDERVSEVMSILRGIDDHVTELRQLARKNNPFSARVQWFSANSLAEIIDLQYEEALKLVQGLGADLVRERDYSMDVRYGAPADGNMQYYSHRLARHIISIVEKRHLKIRFGFCRP